MPEEQPTIAFITWVHVLEDLLEMTGVSFETAFHVSYFACEAIVILLLLDDHRNGRIRPPYILLLSILTLQHLSFVFSPGFVWWSSVTSWLRGD